jgi:hypothetical protein
MVTDGRARVRAPRRGLVAVGIGLAALGGVFLAYTLALLVSFPSRSVSVGAGEVFQWERGDAFVQPQGLAPLMCVVRDDHSAARVTLHAATGALVPGEFLARPDSTEASLTCEAPARVVTGAAARLYPASGPDRSPYLFGAIAALGLALWLLGRRRRPS